MRRTIFLIVTLFFSFTFQNAECGGTISRVSSSPARKPIILFLVDGLRPDRFRLAVQEGLMPNLKALFIDRGVELESYTQRSLTLPSWSTIFTGFESDTHGIRSNTPISKIHRGLTQNYLDPVPDLLSPLNFNKNRAFQRLEENQVGEKHRTWLAGYYDKNESYLNYMPISHEPHLPILPLLNDYFNHRGDYVNQSRFIASALDTASANETAKAILNDHTGKLKLIVNWYASVDEASHKNNSRLPQVYHELDRAISKVIRAAQKHPQLKEATVFLISDHGHTSGFGPFNEKSNIYTSPLKITGTAEGPFLRNTSLNLTRFFSGYCVNLEKYRFNVKSPLNEPSPFDLGLMTQPLPLNPFEGTSLATAYVDYSGDNLAQVYLAEGSHPNRRLNYFQLASYSESKLNIPNDLLSIFTPNLATTDEGLIQALYTASELHPIHLFSMALPGSTSRISADLLDTHKESGPSDREPVLVLARRKEGTGLAPVRAALILTRNGPNGNDLFRYVVVRNFSQDTTGKISGEVSEDPSDDPLEYIQHGILPGPSESPWLSDRDWIQRTRRHPLPTAIFSLARTLTLHPRYTDTTSLPEAVRKHRRSEIPDFIVIAHPGFSFHADNPLESDHGGLLTEEVRNSFFVSSMNPRLFQAPRVIEEPVFSRDIMATVLDYGGFGEPGNDPLPLTHGKSAKPKIERSQTSQLTMSFGK